MATKYLKALILFFTLYSVSSHAQWQEFSHVAMTTPIHLVFWERDTHKAEKISREVFEEFDRIEQQMSRYIVSSELSMVNRQAYDQVVTVTPSFYAVLKSAMNVSKLSGGAFDITFASVGYMYDFRGNIQPTNDQLSLSLNLFNYQNIVLNDDDFTVKFTKKGVLIDLGGIAKGYSVDRGIEILKGHSITSAHLSAGGDMKLLGDKNGVPWVVGIQNPRDESQNSIVLPLSNTAVSTSGDYKRFFMNEAGERIHHILSPKTGKPVKGIRSVTILANDTMTSDGLSTAVFVLGAEAGLSLINQLNGIDAILIDEYGKVHYSEGLMRPE